MSYNDVNNSDEIMDITLTDFRTRMFKLLPRVKEGEILTITHKKQEYTLLSADKLRKLKLIDALNCLPPLGDASQDEIRKAIDEGRS
jgi:hypothetical protein